MTETPEQACPFSCGGKIKNFRDDTGLSWWSHSRPKCQNWIAARVRAGDEIPTPSPRQLRDSANRPWDEE